METNIKDRGDFKEYYDNGLRRVIWVLGYFGGGSVNIFDAYKIAKQYALENNVHIESVNIDEILYSRIFKSFKYLYSTVEVDPTATSERMDNVFAWLAD